MSTKSKSKQAEALQLLDDLDSLAPPSSLPGSDSSQGSQPPPGGEAEVYAFIDEITQKSSEPLRTTTHIERPLSRAGTPNPTVRKSTERVRLGSATPLLPTPAPAPPPIPAPAINPIPSEGEVGGDGGGPGRFESATRPRQISGINNEASNPSLTQDVTYLASALE